MGVCGSKDDPESGYDSRDSEEEDERNKDDDNVLTARGQKKYPNAAYRFQIWLGGRWKDYGEVEDKILKSAWLAGYPNAKFLLRKQSYTYDFEDMQQWNDATGKVRKIRGPKGWKRPKKPLVPQGHSTIVHVKKGWPGRTVPIKHPLVKGAFIQVNVPATAKPGQAMIVPVPPEKAVQSDGTPAQGGWSTGGKVAAAGVGVAAVGGLAVGGAILAEAIAEEGLEDTLDGVADGIGDIGELAGEGIGAVGDWAVDAGEFLVEETEELGDFVMELF